MKQTIVIEFDENPPIRDFFDEIPGCEITRIEEGDKIQELEEKGGLTPPSQSLLELARTASSDGFLTQEEVKKLSNYVLSQHPDWLSGDSTKS